MKKFLTVSLLLIALCVCLTGCGLFGGKDSLPMPDSLMLDSAAKTVCVGDTVQLTATYSPENTQKPTITWTSNNEVCATVDKNGKVTTLQIGEVIITATSKSGGLTASCAITIAEIDESLITRVIQPTSAAYDIPQPSLPYDNIQKVLLTEEKQTYTYSYHAPETGRYCMFSTFYVNCTVFDTTNNEIVDSKPIYGDGKYYDFMEAHNYNIKITKYTSSGNCEIKIFSPNPTYDVSGKTIVKDSMRFQAQNSPYFYTPKVAGFYSFDISMYVKLKIYDSFDNLVDSSTFTNSFQIELKANEKYKIVVTQDKTMGDYTLTINQPNEKVDISGKKKVFDAMRFTGQANRYDYMPTQTGSFSLVTSMDVQFRVYDTFDNLISTSGTMYGTSSFQIDLKANEKYKIVLIKDKTMGEYTLTINPKI